MLKNEPKISFHDSPIVSGRDWFFVAAILLASFFYMAFYNSHPIKSIGGDQIMYNRLALNMLNGHGFSQCVAAPYFPSIWRTPAYPAFLAAIYSVFGVENFEAVRFAQIILMLLSALMTFQTACLASKSKCTAFIALLLFSFYGFGYHTGLGVYGYLFTEPLLMFSVSAVVWLLALIVVKKRMRYAVLLGGFIALAMLVRPSNLLFPIAAALFMLWVDFSKQTAKLVAAMILATALVVAPWTFRNYSQFGEIIPLSVSLKGAFIYMGIAEANNLDYISNPYLYTPVKKSVIPQARRAEADKALSEIREHGWYGSGGPEILKYDDELKDIGLAAVSENKVIFLKRWGYRVLDHWSIGDYADLFYLPQKVFTIKDCLKNAIKALLILFVVFAVVQNYKKPVFLTLLLFPVYNTLIYTPVTMEYRYCLPARGMSFIVMAIGLCGVLRNLCFIQKANDPSKNCAAPG